MTTVEELIITISKFTPQQLDLFRSAAQQIVEQQQGQDLIRKSGRILRDTPEHLVYRAILQTMYRNKIQDIQETLRKCGCRELNLKE